METVVVRNRHRQIIDTVQYITIFLQWKYNVCKVLKTKNGKKKKKHFKDTKS